MITPDARRYGIEKNLPPPLYGLALTGGSNSRPNGAAPQPVHAGLGQIAKAYELLDEHCEIAFVAAGQDEVAHSRGALFPQIVDAFEPPGPMGSVLSALRTCPNAAWMVVACDLPGFGVDMVAHLIVNRNPAQAITACIIENDGLPEPLCAIYEPRSRELLMNCAKEGLTGLCRALVHLEPHVERLAPLRLCVS